MGKSEMGSGFTEDIQGDYRQKEGQEHPPRRRGQPRKGEAKVKHQARSVRPDSPDELKQWQAIADREGVSLHTLMLYAIRRTVAQLEAGELIIPKEEVENWEQR